MNNYMKLFSIGCSTGHTYIITSSRWRFSSSQVRELIPFTVLWVGEGYTQLS